MSKEDNLMVRQTVGRCLLAALFLMGGVGHFAATDVYLRIMPPSLPEPRILVWISGAAEVLLGVLLLISATRRAAAWGLIALLVAVFPANVFMWQHPESFPIPPWALLVRLPLQGLLIAWAWVYTRPESLASPEPTDRPGSVNRTVVAALACFLTFGGCGVGGSSLGRLQKGTTARTQSSNGQPIAVYFAASEETLPAGTVVKVVSDEEGTTNQVDRKVIVGFGEGPHQGLAALVRRSDLEPDR